MGGTALKFESWKVQNHIQDASQHHFYCFSWEKCESGNPAINQKCPIHGKIICSSYNFVFHAGWKTRMTAQSHECMQQACQNTKLQATLTSPFLLTPSDLVTPRKGNRPVLHESVHRNSALSTACDLSRHVIYRLPWDSFWVLCKLTARYQSAVLTHS